MNIRAVLLATTLLHAAPALALVDPPSASKNDGHVRSVVYDPNNPVQLFVSPGASLRIELGADEQVATIVVSDQRTITPTPEAPPPSNVTGGLGGQASQVPSSCDPNLCRSVAGNFVYLKPLRQLDPQPLFIQTSRTGEDGKLQMIPYTFVLLTKPADAASNSNIWASTPTVWSVTFTYPARIKAAQVAAWIRQKHVADEAQQKLAEMTKGAPVAVSSHDNVRYGYRGSAAVRPDAVWDDGRSTFLRYNGNRRIPNVYNRLPDGHESIPAVSPEPDATGNTLRIAHTEAKWFMRDGDEAGCVFDLGPDPDGRSTATIADARVTP